MSGKKIGGRKHADDFSEGVYEEEKVLTGGLHESIKY
jgi:hypothetical protein